MPLAAAAQFLQPTNPPASVTLAWNPVAGAASYKIYYGVGSGQYTNVISAGNATNLTIGNLVRGTLYYFAATTVDTNGLESLFSGEVTYRPNSLPQPPILRLAWGSPGTEIDGSGEPFRSYAIDASPDLAAWSKVGDATADGNGLFTFLDQAVLPARFYRARAT